MPATSPIRVTESSPRPPAGPPVLFCLHFLGGSGRTWDALIQRLSGTFRCVALDLPGFGAASDEPGYSVAEMADRVADRIRDAGATPFALLGHSMGAKVALAVARRAEDGESGLGGLTHLVLLAGSPPAPEPMEEGRRERMKGWFAGPEERSRAEAQDFVSGNVGRPLDPATHDRTVDDVLRTRRAAWLAWLDGGSREDWRARIGTLRTPALVLAGAEDGDLGRDAQDRHMATHFETVRVETIEGAGHLLPLERPDEVARLVAAHLVAARPSQSPELSPAFLDLIGSDRVSARTRKILLDRARDVEGGPQVLDAREMETLRAAFDRIVPQPAARRIDLAARFDALLATGRDDGWRFAALPDDLEACRAGLATLDAASDGGSFAALSDVEEDAILRKAEAGELSVKAVAGGAKLLDAPQTKLWFEDLRSAAVRFYVAHPATMARIGYDGFAYGGDGERLQGFHRIGIGEQEEWEPSPARGVAP